jgi:pyruvate dehydrogenase E2 component (dihydrolipoamide acetyltransferase)
MSETVSQTAKGEVTREELSRPQQLVARRMAESKATAPELVLCTEIEMNAAAAERER